MRIFLKSVVCSIIIKELRLSNASNLCDTRHYVQIPGFLKMKKKGENAVKIRHEMKSSGHYNYIFMVSVDITH